MDKIRQYEPLWGSWYVEKRIGKGSFGSVYKVTRKTRNKTLVSAVKLISIPVSEEEISLQRKKNRSEKSIKDFYNKQVEKLEQEIILMEEMKGASNIVTIEDFMIRPKTDAEGNETIGYDVLIRMEYLTSLEQYLQDHEPDEREVIRLGRDLCKALEHCEKNNIIHRDIKPENVFRNKFGEYKIGDFGISRQMDHTTKATSTGTPLYMAPEVMFYQPYNQTADIYSVGLMMYQILNHNRLPFMPDYPEEIWPGDNEKAVKERLSGKELPEIAGVSEDLMQIIIKAASFKKENRYQHPAQMLDDLNRCLSEMKAEEREEESENYPTDPVETEEYTSDLALTDEEETTIPEIIEDSSDKEETVKRGIEKLEADDKDKVDGNPVKIDEKPEKKIGLLLILAMMIFGGLGLWMMISVRGRDDSKEATTEEATTEEATTEEATTESLVPSTQSSSAMTKPIFDNLAIGDLITFGSYEQDYDTRKPEKPISWKVLDEVEGCYLLISEYGLDVEPYDFEYQDMTWENCSLRAWLNSDFFDSAFSEEEKQIIKTAQVKAEDNPEYGTKAGNDTQDKVFLLNISEAEKYFSSDESRQCKATGYAVYDGAWVDTTTGAYEWWLRSPGENNSYAATVNSYGSIDYEGGNLFEVVVRPALWINP